MEVQFCGVRGSIAVSGPGFLRTGGATSCVAVVHDGHRLVLDGGTGLASLGDVLGFQPVDLTLLFSHVHWDHVQGVPFFAPAYHPDSRILVVGATRGGRGIREALEEQMRPPLFPVTLDALRARLSFRDAGAGEPFEVGPFRVRALDQPHPDGVLAWKIEAGGRSMVYATDIEHGGRLDPALVRFAADADLLIHDAQYTEEEYVQRRGWGHSTWAEAVEVARAAGVGGLALFHHDRRRSDEAVAVIEAQARQRFGASFAARERQVVGL